MLRSEKSHSETVDGRKSGLKGRKVQECLDEGINFEHRKRG